MNRGSFTCNSLSYILEARNIQCADDLFFLLCAVLPCEATGFVRSQNHVRIHLARRVSYLLVSAPKVVQPISILGGTTGSSRRGFRCNDSMKRWWKWPVSNNQWRLLKRLRRVPTKRDAAKLRNKITRKVKAKTRFEASFRQITPIASSLELK